MMNKKTSVTNFSKTFVSMARSHFFSSIKNIILTLCLLFSIGFSGIVYASWPPSVTISDGAESDDGIYTVTVTAELAPDSPNIPCDFDCENYNKYEIYERANQDEWSPDPISKSTLTKNTTFFVERNNSTGTYEYRVYVERIWVDGTGFENVDSISEVTKSIVVTILEKPGKTTINKPAGTYDLDGQYIVEWALPSGDVSYYKVEERIKNANGTVTRNWLQVQGQAAGAQRQFTTHGSARDKGFTYEYRVIACNDLECSDTWSNIKAIHVP